jgi:hypothetical protein
MMLRVHRISKAKTEWDMPTIVRIIMVLSLVMLALFLAAAVALAFFGDMELLFDIMDLPEEPVTPPSWSLILFGVTIFVGIYGLGRAFWGVHQLLRRVVLSDFERIAVNVGRIATGLLIYWFAICIAVYAMPPLVMWNVAGFSWDVIDYIPFGDEIILFILGIALWAVTGPLRHAHEVQTENDHFL